jgi:hypothetical protein
MLKNSTMMKKPVCVVAILLVTGLVCSEALMCGSTSYRPYVQMCCAGVVNDGIGKNACCGTKAYSVYEKLCCNGVLNYKGGNNACCGTTAYNAVFRRCCGRYLC